MICMGFAGTGWSPSLHGPALLLVPVVFPPGGLYIFISVILQMAALTSFFTKL